MALKNIKVQHIKAIFQPELRHSNSSLRQAVPQTLLQFLELPFVTRTVSFLNCSHPTSVLKQTSKLYRILFKSKASGTLQITGLKQNDHFSINKQFFVFSLSIFFNDKKLS